MSDDWIRIVPSDPSFAPDSKARDRIVEAVRTVMPGAEDIDVHHFDEIQFVDTGGNWEGVRCPRCGHDAETLEDGEWWSRRMGESFETSHFADRRVGTLNPHHVVGLTARGSPCSKCRHRRGQRAVRPRRRP